MRVKSRITEMQAKNQTICEYCGKTKQGAPAPMEGITMQQNTPNFLKTPYFELPRCVECNREAIHYDRFSGAHYCPSHWAAVDWGQDDFKEEEVK